MNIVELSAAFGYKHNKAVTTHKKTKQLMNYINENHIEYYDAGEEVMSYKNFIDFMDTINSVSDASKILSEYKNLTAIGINPKLVAKFYNIYSCEEFYYPGSYVAEMLIDEEYLRVASVEWTKNHIFDGSYDRVLKIDNDKFTTRKNTLTPANEDTYEPSIFQNIASLKIAKEKNMLGKAIESLK